MKVTDRIDTPHAHAVDHFGRCDCGWQEAVTPVTPCVPLRRSREGAMKVTDRIDTDAKPSDLRAWLTFHDLDATEARRMALALLDDRETLRAEVDALRSREVPDGHTRIDGKLYRLEEGHAPRRSVNRRLVPVEEP